MVKPGANGIEPDGFHENGFKGDGLKVPFYPEFFYFLFG